MKTSSTLTLSFLALVSLTTIAYHVDKSKNQNPQTSSSSCYPSPEKIREFESWVTGTYQERIEKTFGLISAHEALCELKRQALNPKN